MKSVLKLFVLSCVFACSSYQSVNNTTKENKTEDGYWQQHVDYKMTIVTGLLVGASGLILTNIMVVKSLFTQIIRQIN